MQLKQFEVRKFRNVVDSTPIDVEPDVTCLVGKNEAGKTALLQALYRLRPAYGETFDVDEQYPRWLLIRDRRDGSVGEAVPISAVFEIEDEDREAVEAVVGPGVLQSSCVRFSLKYDGRSIVGCTVDAAQAVRNVLDRADASEEARDALRECADLAELQERLTTEQQRLATGSEVENAELRERLGAEMARVAQEVQRVAPSARTLWQTVVELLRNRLPTFFYFSEYSMLPGRVDLQQLVPNPEEKPASSGLQTARALLELAETDTTALGNETYEVRKAELEAVSNELTRQVFEYWSQNQDLSVEIDVDKETRPTAQGQTAIARFLDVRVRDRRHGYTNNFQQRSSGFQWFFSFLAAFSQFETLDTGVVVLLDEPALGLHARAQADFLRFIDQRLAPDVQVIYTTHSPFMVEMGRLERLRIVEDRGAEQGTAVSADPLAADRDSIFPLQAALGYDIAQSLFVGPDNLVVEGMSDYTYLTVLSDYLVGEGQVGLDSRWRLLPTGGSSNIPAFVALVGPHLDVTVLADTGSSGMQRLESLQKAGLLKNKRLVTIAEITGTGQADIEDLFAVSDYLELFNGAFGKTLKANDLPAGDRVVKRLERAIGSSFDHRRPAEYLLRNREKVLPKLCHETADRFEQLCERVNETLS